jgi:hypothetical protein
MEEYKRNCPICGTEIVYKNKWGVKRANKENRKCLTCFHKSRIGTKRSDLTKEKMSKASKGKKKSKSHCENISKAKRGSKMSDVGKEKLKNRWKNNPHPFLGKSHSSETKKKMSESAKSRLSNPQNNPMYGKTHTDEVKSRIAKLNRIHLVKKLKSINKDFHPPFNEAACEYLDSLSKERGWNLQHAMNGGEFYIKELGYWVDGYDADRNIVVEYDEPAHDSPTQKERDMIRQFKIINHLNCRFYRYNEKKQMLTEVNDIYNKKG